ncbi:uncharacterized protein LOC110848442 isoform X2 [Folsomia candida]|uniref:uncharacterized protein LOC110848442 isoform X2 n=1 Tax=Folsomia candida TaxID=158441 RepID=UPI001604B4D8|nr:uncharacterized protein LOC110848442 isoform X2 [Folsomia candida]
MILNNSTALEDSTAMADFDYDQYNQLRRNTEAFREQLERLDKLEQTRQVTRARRPILQVLKVLESELKRLEGVLRIPPAPFAPPPRYFPHDMAAVLVCGFAIVAVGLGIFFQYWTEHWSVNS